MDNLIGTITPSGTLVGGIVGVGGGSGVEKFVINFTNEDNTIISDKTIQEIVDAYNSGKIIEGLYLFGDMLAPIVLEPTFISYEENVYSAVQLLGIFDTGDEMSSYAIVGLNDGSSDEWSVFAREITDRSELSDYATKNDIKVQFNDGEQTYTWTTSQDMFNYIETNVGGAIQAIFNELDGKQTKSNMEQTINSASTNYKYPSSEAVYNYGNIILDISSYQTGDVINDSSMVAKIKDERTILKYNNIWFRRAAIYGTGYVFTVMSGTEYGQWITLNYRQEYDDFYFYEVGTANWEVPSNKVTTITSSSKDSEYPSAKAVYTLVNNEVGNIETILNTLNSGGGAS